MQEAYHDDCDRLYDSCELFGVVIEEIVVEEELLVGIC